MITLAQFGGAEKIPAALISNANQTIVILNEIFAAFPNTFRFTSGYRSAARNKAAGGVPTSYHIKALAGDFVPVAGNPNLYKAKVSEIAAKHGYEVLYHNVGSGLHFHIEPVGKKKR